MQVGMGINLSSAVPSTSCRCIPVAHITSCHSFSRRTSYRRLLVCNVQPGVDRDANLRKNLPAAPPPRMPPPPPPPPPPPEVSDIKLSRRGLAGLMLGGSLAWYAAISGFATNAPIAGVDRQRNIAVLRTKGGNLVAATTDDQGRVFMFDKAGNIYYDTEDPRTGMYIVDRRGDMYNVYVDLDGKVKRVPVGNISELATVEVGEVGGVSLKELQKSVGEVQSGRITGFLKKVDPSNAQLTDLMPPTAPADIRPDGTFGPPPLLEDLELELEKQPFTFGAKAPESYPDLMELLRSLRREGR